MIYVEKNITDFCLSLCLERDHYLCNYLELRNRIDNAIALLNNIRENNMYDNSTSNNVNDINEVIRILINEEVK